jgi:hypothetical protein
VVIVVAVLVVVELKLIPAPFSAPINKKKKFNKCAELLDCLNETPSPRVWWNPG